MRRIEIPFLLVILCACCGLQPGCEGRGLSDPCRQADCLNGGTCTRQGCQCSPGFTGLRCEINLNIYLTGRYTGWARFSQGGKSNMETIEGVRTASAGGEGNRFQVVGMFGASDTLVAELENGRIFTIRDQAMRSGTLRLRMEPYQVRNESKLRLRLLGNWTLGGQDFKVRGDLWKDL